LLNSFFQALVTPGLLLEIPYVKGKGFNILAKNKSTVHWSVVVAHALVVFIAVFLTSLLVAPALL
jgi:hypothetical protein